MVFLCRSADKENFSVFQTISPKLFPEIYVVGFHSIWHDESILMSTCKIGFIEEIMFPGSDDFSYLDLFCSWTIIVTNGWFDTT